MNFVLWKITAKMWCTTGIKRQTDEKKSAAAQHGVTSYVDEESATTTTRRDAKRELIRTRKSQLSKGNLRRITRSQPADNARTNGPCSCLTIMPYLPLLACMLFFFFLFFENSRSSPAAAFRFRFGSRAWYTSRYRRPAREFWRAPKAPETVNPCENLNDCWVQFKQLKWLLWSGSEFFSSSSL
jgi:hypothetical protein